MRLVEVLDDSEAVESVELRNLIGDYMTPIRRSDGAITNAAELTIGNVVHQRVVCPSCSDFVFEMWPEGWDSHAARKCAGLSPLTEQERKREFKTRYGYLFR